jgi:hypothetical protein
MIKKLIIGALALVFVGVALILFQIWFSFISEVVFIKSLITLAILIGADIILVLILYHFREEAEFRKDNFMN